MNVHDKTKPLSYWGARVLLAGVTACVPVFIEGYFTYQTSKAEQAAGYAETRKAVEELQEQAKELSKDVSYLKGRLDQRAYTTMHEAPPPPPAPVQFRKMPERFEDVVRQAVAK
jgi:hypothetical protein